MISIHAPRVGSDPPVNSYHPAAADFNPRSPCGERLYGDIKMFCTCRRFQSTLPVWGATPNPAFYREYFGISIHAPRVGSDFFSLERLCGKSAISIHAPRVGSDFFQRRKNCQRTISIHAPRVGSDLLPLKQSKLFFISIHAPRVGSDSFYIRRTLLNANFNPRSPCGERLRSADCRRCKHNFNPRSPCGERHFITKIWYNNK